MRLSCLLFAFAVQTACESIPLYEGDRDPFARMIDVIEPIDISPTDRGTLGLPTTAKVNAPPASLAAPLPRSERNPQPVPKTASVIPSLPTPAIPAPVKAPQKTTVPQPPPTSSSDETALDERPPSSIAGLSNRQQLPRQALPDAARLAVIPKPVSQPSLDLDDAKASVPKGQSQRLEADPKQGDARTLAVAAPPSPPKEKLPAVPTPPPAPSQAVAALPTPPQPAPSRPRAQPDPVSLASSKPSSSESAPDGDQPTARDRGRPLIKRSNKVAQTGPGEAGFSSLDGESHSELGTQIGGMARPVGIRTPQVTRAVVSSAKGMLAECYVNEQLFQDDAKGTAVVVIEVPKAFPNRPRIETSDFSDTMNACLLDAVRNLPFPGDPEGAVYRLRIPFRFRPD